MNIACCQALDRLSRLRHFVGVFQEPLARLFSPWISISICSQGHVFPIACTLRARFARLLEGQHTQLTRHRFNIRQVWCSRYVRRKRRHRAWLDAVLPTVSTEGAGKSTAHWHSVAPLTERTLDWQYRVAALRRRCNQSVLEQVAGLVIVP